MPVRSGARRGGRRTPAQRRHASRETLLLALLLACFAAPTANASTAPASSSQPAAVRPAPPASARATGSGAPAQTLAQARPSPPLGAPDRSARSSEATPPGDKDAPEPPQVHGASIEAPIEGTSKMLKKQAFIIPAGETEHGDRYFIGKAAQIIGILEGDFHAIAESIKVTGSVTEDLNALAQDIDMNGEVEDDARVLGRDVQVTGRIGGDLLALGGQVDVLPGAVIGGRTVALGQEITLSGRFTRDVRAAGGEIVFGGQAEGSVDVESDVLRFQPGAHIKGDLTYKARQKLEALDGDEARKIVEGEILYVPHQIDTNRSSRGKGFWLWQCWTFLSAFIVGCLFIAVGRGAIRPIVEAPQKEPLWSFGFGLLGHVFAPFAGVILLVLCLTIPLGLLVLTAWGALFYLAKLVVSASLGDAILRALGRKPSLYVALLFGMIPVWILFKVPVLGSLLYFFVVPILGIGAILIGLRTCARSAGQPGPPPGAGPGAPSPLTQVS